RRAPPRAARRPGCRRVGSAPRVPEASAATAALVASAASADIGRRRGRGGLELLADRARRAASRAPSRPSEALSRSRPDPDTAAGGVYGSVLTVGNRRG